MLLISSVALAQPQPCNSDTDCELDEHCFTIEITCDGCETETIKACANRDTHPDFGIPGTCTADDACTPEQFCAEHQLTLIACTNAGECADQGRGMASWCVDHECQLDEDCTEEGTICVNNSCVPPEPLCEGSICGMGQSCVEGRCVDDPAPDCNTEGCPNGEECIEGLCMPLGSCISDADCPDELVCEGQQCQAPQPKPLCGDSTCTDSQYCWETNCVDLVLEDCGDLSCQDGQRCLTIPVEAFTDQCDGVSPCSTFTYHIFAQCVSADSCFNLDHCPFEFECNGSIVECDNVGNCDLLPGVCEPCDECSEPIDMTPPEAEEVNQSSVGGLNGGGDVSFADDPPDNRSSGGSSSGCQSAPLSSTGLMGLLFALGGMLWLRRRRTRSMADSRRDLR